MYDADCAQSFAEPNNYTPWDLYAGTNIWSTGAWARNVPRRLMRNVKQTDYFEQGVHNYLVHVGKDIADSGNFMLLFNGVRVAGYGEQVNYAVLITGTCYNPKV